MKDARISPFRALLRAYDRLFEWTSARPLSIVVFLASIALLVYLQTSVQGGLRVQAVARANTVEHPALVVSFVSNVYVRPGDRVEEGTPLAELSPYFVERDLERVNAQIEQILRESRLAQAQLLVEEERWLRNELRTRPTRPSLEAPTEAAYDAQLRVLQTQREQLLGAREQLTVKSRLAGRVAVVLAPGTPVGLEMSVAAVTPEWAEEIVSYLPPEQDATAIAPGSPVAIIGPARACAGQAHVLRRGAAVELAPGQLTQLFRFPLHGTPVFISVPEGCRFGVGQVLSVELTRETVG
jgi:multidrug efflux pump subunit AcrA (membrane-fusion protein)